MEYKKIEYKGECGCIVTVVSPRADGVLLDYCPMHKAALELYEALEVATTRIHNSIRYEPAGEYRAMMQKDLAQGLKALAKAKSKQDEH